MLRFYLFHTTWPFQRVQLTSREKLSFTGGKTHGSKYRVTRLKVQIQTGSLDPEHAASALPTQAPSIGTLL